MAARTNNQNYVLLEFDLLMESNRRKIYRINKQKLIGKDNKLQKTSKSPINLKS